MRKKDILILLTIVTFCTIVFSIWKVVQIPAIEKQLENLIFSNKRYAKHIKIETYFMTRTQIAELFKDNKTPNMSTQPPNESDSSLYLVVRLKNVGNGRPYGIISCKISEFTQCELKTGILVGPNFENYVIPTCYTTSNPPPSLPTIKWKELYTNK